MTSGRIWCEVGEDDESPDDLMVVGAADDEPTEPNQRRGRRPQRPAERQNDDT